MGKFILATNERDAHRLPAEEMLSAYKGQGVGPERGFRFLKDPWFFADSLFLKSPRRTMAADGTDAPGVAEPGRAVHAAPDNAPRFSDV
ncbi:MAG: hypothetical protein Q9O62_08145 [Ardenticatenia bacterium]|nr:hypothetical protein [Ardenticatenia bacterium]